MKLVREIFGDVVVIHTPEELTADNAEEFESALSTMAQRKIVVDLDGTEALDSRGLESLLDVYDRLRDLEGDLRVFTTNPANRKILEMTRLDQHLEVFDNVVDAVKSFA